MKDEHKADFSKTTEKLRHEIAQRRLAEANLANELNKFQTLYDLAVAMSGELSLDEDLSLVVEHSRKLLGTDTSYIALRDEAAGQVYMHTLSGVNTAAFKTMKIPFGAGLGGKIAKNGKGCIVEDYFQEIGPLVHDIVRAEGLISGIAVPIQIGDTNLGVLYVFNRTRTSFSQSDLDTLSLLGNLAALEITRRRAEQDLREARDHLEKRVAERTDDLKKANEKLVLEIEERKKAQEALLRSEQMLSKILSASPLGIGYVEQGELKWTNQAMCDMFGYEREEDYLGKNPAAFYGSEEEYTRVRELLRQSLKQDKPAETEAVFSRRDGSKFYGHIRMSAVDRSDVRTGTISTIFDISARKRAQEQQRESDERYRTLVENSFDGIFVQKGTEIVFANARLHEMLGYDYGELTGKEHWIVYHPDYRDVTRERAQARLRGEIVTPQYEVRLLRKDGSSFHGEINARAVLLGNERGIQVWVRDVDERKLSEEALRESEEKYRTIIENIEEVYYQVDPAGNYVFLNESAAKSFGYEKDAMIGRNFREFMSKEYADRTFRTFNRVFATGKSESAHALKFLAQDGSERSVEISISPIKNSKGRLTGFRGICRDVTERKRAEEELLKLQKLKAIGVLAGGMAHDFNNILTSIQGNISAARMDKNLGEESLKRLNEAQRATVRARDLTHQLLIFAEGGAPIKKAAAVSHIVTDSCNFALRGSNVRCEFSIPDDIWIVEVDEVQISRVVGNLVMNADQAMFRGGVITVTAENLTVKDEQGLPLKPGDYVRISIEDQGTGMDEEILPKIFDPYFTTRPEGSGLGLYAAHAIMMSHHGLITVESESGVGSIFHIFVPASREETPPRPEADDRLVTGAVRILLMDDEEPIRDVTGELLSMLGYEVDTTKDGKEAVERYRSAADSQRPYDAVILDLTVPGGMGGREAVHNLAEIDPDVVAIVSSGYSNDPIMADYRKFGFSGVIPKPYDAETLGRILKAVLGRKDRRIGKH